MAHRSAAAGRRSGRPGHRECGCAADCATYRWCSRYARNAALPQRQCPGRRNPDSGRECQWGCHSAGRSRPPVPRSHCPTPYDRRPGQGSPGGPPQAEFPYSRHRDRSPISDRTLPLLSIRPERGLQFPAAPAARRTVLQNTSVFPPSAWMLPLYTTRSKKQAETSIPSKWRN